MISPPCSTVEAENKQPPSNSSTQKDPDVTPDVTTCGENFEEDAVILSPLAEAVAEGSADASAEGSADASKTMSEDGNSSLNHSQLSQSTTSTRPRLQGLFQTGPIMNNQGGVKKNSDLQCPFPNEWQFGTVPEVIANDEDVD